MAQAQLSILSRGPLIEPKVRDQYLVEMRNRGVPKERERAAALAEWVQALAAAGRVTTKAKETSLEQLFNQKILVEVLGYALYPGAEGSAWPKTPTSVTGTPKEPDVMLGGFVPGDEPEFSAALELKIPNTDLDAPQAGRTPPLSPVEQAFDYGERILGVRWVLVSDMQVIRLYSIESPHESLSFDLRRCVTATGTPTPQLRELYWFLAREHLIEGGEESAVSRLLAKSVSQQLAIRDGFYDVYYEIRADILSEIVNATSDMEPVPDRDEILRATQRLLDRMLFLYYCEDNPERLIPPDTIKATTEAARSLPGPSANKVYGYLKALFREVDEGSPVENVVRLPAYNGELFKHDPIIDEIDLPDRLHDKQYRYDIAGEERIVHGAWGLHAFDFWRELNEHLLGHVFEQSLSDLQVLAQGKTPDRGKLKERKRHGIYYTSEILSDYLCGNAVAAVLNERTKARPANRADLWAELESRQTELANLQIADLACGSGAFLVSSYQVLLEEFWRISDGLSALQSTQPDLLSLGQTMTQAQLLRETLNGADLLPQAVEIAKLALWLRSARKNEKVPDLASNLITADSIAIDDLLAGLDAQAGAFDLIVGNPPWGGEIDARSYDACCRWLGIDPEPRWDSWELFVGLGLKLLKDGGRLALVLPDTIFSPEKARTRRSLLDSGRIEFFHNLGTDWFTKVRMGTVAVQIRRGTVPTGSTFRSLLLTGDRRRKAIRGDVRLTQLVETFGREIPQDRCSASPTAEIEVFRSKRDDELIDRMLLKSRDLAEITTRHRGEEMSKAGLLWICPSCGTATVPAKKRKRDSDDERRYEEKECPGCELTLDEDLVSEELLVQTSNSASSNGDRYIDGDDISRRYLHVKPTKVLRTDFKGFRFKATDIFAAPKLLIRQAGVGVLATLDETGARVPQSVYIYRLKDEWHEKGYSLPFLLGVLLSRTIAYFVFKRFSEVDPARAHAKVTHERLSSLPIPVVDFTAARERQLHDQVAESALKLLNGEAELGGTEDMQIDVALRELWGLSPEDGLHVALELAQLPEGQVIRDLYPKGVPKQILGPSDSDADSEKLTPAVPV